MVTNPKIERLEARQKRLPMRLGGLLGIFEGLLLLAYGANYLPGLIAFLIGALIFSVGITIFNAILNGYEEQLTQERRKAEIEAGERLTNDEPITTFIGVRKYRVKSDDGLYEQFVELTEDRKQELINTGLLRDPNPIGYKGVSH